MTEVAVIFKLNPTLNPTAPQSLAGERYPHRAHGAREPLETVCGQRSVELARDHTPMSQRLERDLKVHLVLQMEVLVL